MRVLAWRTFKRMRALSRPFSTCLLREHLCHLLILPVELLYSLIMVVHGHAEDLLRSLLSNHELVEMLLQYPRRDFWDADGRGIFQRSFGRTGLVETGITTTMEIRAVELALVGPDRGGAEMTSDDGRYAEIG